MIFIGCIIVQILSFHWLKLDSPSTFEYYSAGGGAEVVGNDIKFDHCFCNNFRFGGMIWHSLIPECMRASAR